MTQITHTLLTTNHLKRTFTYEFGGLLDLEALPFSMTEARDKFPDKVEMLVKQIRDIPAPMNPDGSLDMPQLATLVMWWAHVSQVTALRIVEEIQAELTKPALDLVEVMGL